MIKNKKIFLFLILIIMLIITIYSASSAYIGSNLNMSDHNITNIDTIFADRLYGNITGSQITDQSSLNVNSSGYWDNLNSPSDLGTADLTNDANFITDGNTNWDNSYGFFNNITNFTGTLTDTKWCKYVSSTETIDCNVDSVTGDLVDDTTPQLGGNLDMNSKNITTTDSGTITSNSTCAIILSGTNSTVCIE